MGYDASVYVVYGIPINGQDPNLERIAKLVVCDDDDWAANVTDEKLDNGFYFFQ